MQTSKVDSYISGLYKNKKHPWQKAIAGLLYPFVGCGLAAWAVFFNGPDRALAASFVVIWCFIILNGLALGMVAWLGYLRTKISTDHPKLSDSILFTDTYAATVSKVIIWIDTPCLIFISMSAGWTVTSVILGVMFALEITSKSITKNNQALRRLELENISETDLRAALVTPEEEAEMREQIDRIFRKS